MTSKQWIRQPKRLSASANLWDPLNNSTHTHTHTHVEDYYGATSAEWWQRQRCEEVPGERTKRDELGPLLPTHNTWERRHGHLPGEELRQDPIGEATEGELGR